MQEFQVRYAEANAEDEVRIVRSSNVRALEPGTWTEVRNKTIPTTRLRAIRMTSTTGLRVCMSRRRRHHQNLQEVKTRGMVTTITLEPW